MESVYPRMVCGTNIENVVLTLVMWFQNWKSGSKIENVVPKLEMWLLMSSDSKYGSLFLNEVPDYKLQGQG